ncbi:uncharacterized protein LOC120349991 [Nilaparvata lugens]|uniref:uncharacterized protein LOC120349991 n=1 Tax=Nilaparvata lugens TaxID=108931 RepID=UPI00193D16E7|nr:uncharacterized protein LOC120349991 [Nilaparvata lugens]
MKKIISFINEIEMRPVMWDVCHVDYKNRNKKHDAMNKISEIFKCDTTEVLRKWKIILAQFRREKQKIKASKRMGSAASEVYILKWFGSQHLEFLNDRDEPNESINTLDDINDQSTEMQQQGGEELFTENEQVAKKSVDTSLQSINLPIKRSTAKRQRLHNKNDAMVSEAYEVMKGMQEKLDHTNNDAIQVFSTGVTAKLRQIPNDRIKLLVQRDIDNLLYDAILGIGKYHTTPMPSPYSGSHHTVTSISPSSRSNELYSTANPNDTRVDHQSTEYSVDDSWYMK